MPALSDTMSNGRLVKWAKKPGDRIKKGDVIAEVETDKAVMDVEAFEDGYLRGPLAAEGSEAPVGEVIGYIADDAAEPAAIAAAESPRPAAADASAAAAPARWPSPVSAVLAASIPVPHPPSRRRELPAMRPSDEAERKPVAALAGGPPYRIERASPQREAVARNMIASAVTPTFRVTARLPLQPLQDLAKARGLSLALLLARVCALTIKAHPLFNAAYTPDGLAQRERIDVAIAVAEGDSLITPVLRNAADRPMPELAEAWTALRDKAKSRRLAPADYSGATFYISDLGVFAVVDAFDSLIPAGASAILSVAAAREGHAQFTLACDHRVVFGADAARFLTTLGAHLADPAGLLA